MFNRNKFSVGLILGILIPLIAFPLLYGLFTGLESLAFASDDGFRPLFKERTSGIVAIGINAITLNFYNKRKADETMRGIVIATFVYIAIWVYFFGEMVLNFE
jgi:hypothetical protein